MEVASRLPLHVSLVCAVVSGVVLHALAAVLLTPKVDPSGALTGVVTRDLYGTIATILQFVVPLGFLVGALLALIRRLRDLTLFAKARSEPDRAMKEITWAQFERLVGETFRRRGYQVMNARGGGNDGGIDVVVIKGSNRFLVQCKQWRTQRVGVTVVRELYGVVVARKAAGGIVVTCGDFTLEARRFAQDSGVELIDGVTLASLIRDVDRAMVDSGASTVGSPTNSCPKCGSAMALRTAGRGERAGQDFLGCTRYPDCRGIRQLEQTSSG